MKPPKPMHDAQVAQPDRLPALYDRPGFLIRRANQITPALFMEEVEPLGVTATQFGVLVVLAAHQPIDQVGIARLMGLDRSTTGLVVGTLERRGLLERVTDPADRRRRVLNITATGLERLAELEAPSRRAQERALEAFSPEQAAEFLKLLRIFVNSLTLDPQTAVPDPDRN